MEYINNEMTSFYNALPLLIGLNHCCIDFIACPSPHHEGTVKRAINIQAGNIISCRSSIGGKGTSNDNPPIRLYGGCPDPIVCPRLRVKGEVETARVLRVDADAQTHDYKEEEGGKMILHVAVFAATDAEDTAL